MSENDQPRQTWADRQEWQDRLADIDNELASLREELDQLQQDMNQPGDPVDQGSNLQAREELTTRIADLEAERNTLTEPGAVPEQREGPESSG